MSSARIVVRPAQIRDAEEIEYFFRRVQRRYLTFGMEDLPHVLQNGYVIVASAGGFIWGVLAIMPKQGSGWGQIRGVGLIDGWQASVALGMLLAAAFQQIRGHIHVLYIILTETWLHGPLTGQGFVQASRIGTYLRHAHSLPPAPAGPATLRLVRPEDIPAIERVDEAAFPPLWRYSEQELTYLLTLGCRMVVAELGETLVGYACGEVVGDVGHISRLAVHPAWQGRKIGHQLLLDTMAYLHTAGVTRLSLNTEVENVRATRLYESLGFRRFGRLIPVLVRGHEC